ncbi:MAG: squalene synthase HpnC [Pseudomonadota bacterium]
MSNQPTLWRPADARLGGHSGDRAPAHNPRRTMSVEHYENFPVASWLCPRRLRAPITAIYWYARTADDLADEGEATPAQRLADLADYRHELQAAASGAPPAPRWAGVFKPLAEALRQHQLPLPLLQDLLSAFEQDVGQPHYTDRTELLDYCRRSANPVGRLLLHLYGVDDARSLAQSDAICSSLQLINFWQDLSVDLPRGRLYVPLEDAARAGLTAQQLFDGRDDAAARALVAELVDWAERLMLEGAPLATSLPGRIGWELRLVVQGGLRILDQIRQSGHASLRQRPSVGRRDVPLLLWRALRMRHAAPGHAGNGRITPS